MTPKKQQESLGEVGVVDSEQEEFCLLLLVLLK